MQVPALFKIWIYGSTTLSKAFNILKNAAKSVYNVVKSKSTFLKI